MLVVCTGLRLEGGAGREGREGRERRGERGGAHRGDEYTFTFPDDLPSSLHLLVTSPSDKTVEITSLISSFLTSRGTPSNTPNYLPFLSAVTILYQRLYHEGPVEVLEEIEGSRGPFVSGGGTWCGSVFGAT